MFIELYYSYYGRNEIRPTSYRNGGQQTVERGGIFVD